MSKVSKVKSFFDKAQGVSSGMNIADILKRPSIGLPALYFGGRFVGEDVVAPIASGLMDKFRGGPMKRTRAQYEYERRGILQRLQAQMVEERQARDIKLNAMRLMQQEPHLAQEVLLGRKLPRGATVIGYRPRVDLLRELASSMGAGEFAAPPSAGDVYMRAAGVNTDDVLAGL